jgi:hypothetical protein|tara:strand:+ start:279 stop:1148 length:870 start_codon:yes stop_codon:yes gene_type:complete
LTNSITTKLPTGEQRVADSKANALEAALKIVESKRAAHFVSMNGHGEQAEVSAQTAMVERRIRDIIVKHEITAFDGLTIALAIDTGKQAKCYGMQANLERADNGVLVLSLMLHASVFALPKAELDVNILESLGHAIVYARSVQSGDSKPAFGMSISGVHNATFASVFGEFGGIIKPVYEVKSGKSVLTNGSEANRPTGKIHTPTAKILDRSHYDETAIVVVGRNIAKQATRSSQSRISVACAEHGKLAFTLTYRTRKPAASKLPFCGWDAACKKRMSEAGFVATADQRK